jgi:hypothetical protein
MSNPASCKFPDIDLANCSVGIFGKVAQLDAALKPGDRVEIYRAITAIRLRFLAELLPGRSMTINAPYQGTRWNHLQHWNSQNTPSSHLASSLA